MSGFSLPLVDRIWRVRGAVAMDATLSAEETFTRLAPLLDTQGTTIAAEGEGLTYTKSNPAAQDKLATFTRGRLWIERSAAGAVLRFDVFSHALLLCFLAPLLFLGFAQLATTVDAWEKADAASSQKAEDKPKPVRKLNPVDEFLGAPAPEDPNKKKNKEQGPNPAGKGYFMAGLFALIYGVGRWLEPFLLRRRLRALLAGAPLQATGAA